MSHTSRGRKDYRKIDKIPIRPVYFSENIITKPLQFIEEKNVSIDGIKPNYYTVNTLGEVFNNKGKKLTPHMLNSGYQYYSLYTGHGKTSTEKYKHVLVHKLVKNTFDPIENSDQFTIDHKDMNKFNNKLNNLEYVTQKENNSRKFYNRISSGVNNYKSKFNYQQLIEIAKGLNDNLSYSEILDIINIKNNKLNRDYIGNIKRGITYKTEVSEIRKRLGFND